MPVLSHKKSFHTSRIILVIAAYSHMMFRNDLTEHVRYTIRDGERRQLVPMRDSETIYKPPEAS